MSKEEAFYERVKYLYETLLKDIKNIENKIKECKYDIFRKLRLKCFLTKTREIAYKLEDIIRRYEKNGS